MTCRLKNWFVIKRDSLFKDALACPFSGLAVGGKA